MTPGIPDHLYAIVVLGLVFPIGGWIAYRRFLARVAVEGDAALVREYRITLIWQAGLALGALACWWIAARPWTALGFAPMRDDGNPTVFGIALGAMIGLAARPILAALSARHAALMGKGFAKLAPFLPKTREQLLWGLAVSLAAGTCEEIAYRGFLLPYLGGWLDPLWALAAAAAIFGIAHAYQGWLGTIMTGLIGAVLGWIYLQTGSLALPMLLHVALDISAMVTAYIVLRPRNGAAS